MNQVLLKISETIDIQETKGQGNNINKVSKTLASTVNVDEYILYIVQRARVSVELKQYYSHRSNTIFENRAQDEDQDMNEVVEDENQAMDEIVEVQDQDMRETEEESDIPAMSLLPFRS
ncbi:hypothetical protein BCV72DRAFT_301126 [Rhizopus microsporus var. microsporus]|uniref:Uncharacterized protein n=2 Tax=Rhizopus microsporus TaxID=58291 RepID=A0A2G4SJJ6_RHIZD|nr:uncharacterized protein RHIMIDRAFT_241147 [Rhizopus microsporus ATCC 52813]ORE11292.1 hypothetical protein BCV72DRAFT_301126 [Rhizopus microsporus var. microsporus]PHZ08933.1 hypothetical protein RHIMIDRAFT_241147 [Rhizopus microsporus ATCC 52813]